jgi:hypothetical protein
MSKIDVAAIPEPEIEEQIEKCLCALRSVGADLQKLVGRTSRRAHGHLVGRWHESAQHVEFVVRSARRALARKAP